MLRCWTWAGEGAVTALQLGAWLGGAAQGWGPWSALAGMVAVLAEGTTHPGRVLWASNQEASLEEVRLNLSCKL